MVKGPGVVTGRSGSIGNVFFVEEDFWPLNTALYVKDFHGNDERYVYYLLQAFDLSRFASGAGVPTLNRNHVHDAEVLVATELDEQKRIVAALDQAFAALDRARANVEVSLAEIQLLLASFGQEIVAGLSCDWHVLGEMCEIYQPKTIALADLVPDGPYVVYGANGPIGRYTTYNHEHSEVLVTCRGATCGQVNVSEPHSWITGNAMVIRPRSKAIEKEFLEVILRNVVDWGSVITGAAQPQITRTSLAPTRIPVPDMVTQANIVRRSKQLHAAIDELQMHFQRKVDDVLELRRSLLQVAFPGQLS